MYLPVVSLVIFDMDGTITRPYLRFDQIRAEIGVSQAGTLLETMATMSPEEFQRANEILIRHEREAAECSELNEHAATVLHTLRQRGKKLALLTRNSRVSLETVVAKHSLEFDMRISRDDAAPKPSPEPVRMICRQFDVPPTEAVVVGDYLHDITCGRDAGTHTILLYHGDRPDYADLADVAISRLDAVLDVLP